MEKSKGTILRYGMSVLFLALGVLFNSFNVGSRNFLSFGSVGNWLIYIGFVSLMIVTIRTLSKKERKVDERNYFIAAKANRITFIMIILAAFIIMVCDGIKTITLSYHMFMSFFVCGIILAYFVSYKILEKYH